MGFALLGDLRADGRGQAVDLGPARQQCVLAALLVDANRTVSLDQLTERVWGEHPPRQPGVTLRSYVSRLRTALWGAGAADIEHRTGGYALTVEESAVDLHRFRALLSRARDSEDAITSAALLEEALALWRGEPFAGLETPWLTGVRQALQAEHLLARLDYHDVQLGRGEYGGQLAGLTALAEEYPLDERVTGQLMRALYGSGRQADALDQYERLRQRLADELGAYPGAVLQRIHREILTGELPATLFPTAPPENGLARVQQLPSDILGFVGRDEDIARLDKLMDDMVSAADDGPRPVVISAIDGVGGIGKTALAVHWAHRVKRHFPDGQLFLSLRGYGPGEPMNPLDAVESMLRSLGVASERIPADLDERSALLRSELASRRMLLLLDNARDSDQVRPLLPGGDALVLITSRRKLRTLSALHGAHHLSLDLLPVPEALALLSEATNRDRTAREPEAAAAIVALCARLPLALRLAAVRITREPDTPLSSLVSELVCRQNRLEALSVPESIDTDLHSVFAWSYDTLPAEAARMFDLLGFSPSKDIGVPAAAALAGVTPAAAREVLRLMREVSMVEQRFPGRYEVHDLLLEFARDQAERHHIDEQKAIGRLLDWYVHSVAGARRQITTIWHMPIAEQPPDGVVPAVVGSYAEAMEWFDTECDAIVQIVRRATELGQHESAVALSTLSWQYFYLRGHWNQMLETGEAALRSAKVLGDPFLEGKCHNSLSSAYGRLRRHGESIGSSRRALEIFEELGDVKEQATSLLNLGSAYIRVRRFAEALAAEERSRELYLRVGEPLAGAISLTNMAESHAGLGQFDEALRCARQAVDTFSGEEGEPMRVASALQTLAAIHAARGDHEAAICYYRDAIAVAGNTQATNVAVKIRVRLGHQLVAVGEEEQAVDIWREAHQLSLTRSDRATADDIRRLIESLTTAR